MLGAPLDTLANTFGANCWVLSLTECDRRQKTKHMFQLQDCCNVYWKKHHKLPLVATHVLQLALSCRILSGFFETSAAGSSALSSSEVEFFIRLSVVNDEFYLMFCNWHLTNWPLTILGSSHLSSPVHFPVPIITALWRKLFWCLLSCQCALLWRPLRP